MPDRVYWNSQAAKFLQGRTIVKAEYLSDDEVEAMGWDGPSVVIQLDNGTSVVVSRDDEGNGPGALFVSTAENMQILPVL